MRNIIAIIFGFVILATSITFTCDDAQAARRNNKRVVCTCTYGTQQRTCPKHGNSCAYQGPHEHEDNRGRNLSLPLYCRVSGHNGLFYTPTCRDVRDQLNAQKRIQRERQRQEARYQRNIQRGFANIPIISDFQREIRNENQRIQNQVRNDIRRNIRDTVRGWYGR